MTVSHLRRPLQHCIARAVHSRQALVHLFVRTMARTASQSKTNEEASQNTQPIVRTCALHVIFVSSRFGFTYISRLSHNQILENVTESR